MLKKLYKHEFLALCRSLWPAYLFLFVTAIFTRIMQLFNNPSNFILSLLDGIISVLYVLSILAVIAATVVIVVVRFYRNLTTSEGYLTFTLPVKAGSHVTCKMICGAASILVSVVGVVLSRCILAIGTNEIGEFFAALQLFYREAFLLFPSSTVILFTVAVLALIPLLAFVLPLMFYASIAVGQQFKNRIGGAVLSFLGFYIAIQLLSLFSLFPFFFSSAESLIIGMETLPSAAQISAIVSFSGTLLCILFALQLVVGCVFYFLTRYLMTKKLNLE